jgi:hypothetical protein
MKSVWSLTALFLLLSACAGRPVTTDHPPPHMGKTAVQTCTPDRCDQVNVDTLVTAGVCTATFRIQRVVVARGSSIVFKINPLSTEYQYRFDFNGIDIPQGTDPAFAAAYDPRDPRMYIVTALPRREHAEYPFTIHVQWTSDKGTTWSPCTEIDPVIAND